MGLNFFKLGCMSSKSPVNLLLSETINFLTKLHKTYIFGCPRKFHHRVMYIAPSSACLPYFIEL